MSFRLAGHVRPNAFLFFKYLENPFLNRLAKLVKVIKVHLKITSQILC
jgi:hypothetical protein